MKTGFHDVCSFNNKDKKLLLPVQHLGVLFTMHDRGDLRGTTEQVQQSQTFFDSTKPKNSARDNNRCLSSVFFLHSVLTQAFCFIISTVAAAAHLLSAVQDTSQHLDLINRLLQQRIVPIKRTVNTRLGILKKMLFHIILNETEHNKLPTRSLW